MAKNNPILPPLTRHQLREVDQRAVAEYGMSSLVLMENAGRGAAEWLESLRIQGPAVICAGKGNNGGDGFVIARHLDQHGITSTVLVFANPNQLSEDAAANFRILQAAEHPMIFVSETPDTAQLEQIFSACEWIVDALLGTGTKGVVREPYLTAISAINRSKKQVLSVDLPSGMDCDTGTPCGACVVASHTATFVARKIGFDNPAATQYTGAIQIFDIGVPRKLLEQVVSIS